MYQPRQFQLPADDILRSSATEHCTQTWRSPNGWSGPSRTASTAPPGTFVVITPTVDLPAGTDDWIVRFADGASCPARTGCSPRSPALARGAAAVPVFGVLRPRPTRELHPLARRPALHGLPARVPTPPRDPATCQQSWTENPLRDRHRRRHDNDRPRVSTAAREHDSQRSPTCDRPLGPPRSSPRRRCDHRHGDDRPGKRVAYW